MTWRLGDQVTGRQGDWETGRQGDRETRRQGDWVTKRPGDKGTGRQGDRETRRQGDWETRRPGDWETRRPGVPCRLDWNTEVFPGRGRSPSRSHVLPVQSVAKELKRRIGPRRRRNRSRSYAALPVIARRPKVDAAISVRRTGSPGEDGRPAGSPLHWIIVWSPSLQISRSFILIHKQSWKDRYLN